jgi:hypothetical protein
VVVTVGGADSVAMVPPKSESSPTASQLTGLAQATAKREPTPAGTVWPAQFDPPLVVTTMLVPPTAVHVNELMQLTETNGVAPAGVPRSFHWEPPSVVLITCGPVAKHVVSLEQETPSSVVAAIGAICGTHVDPPFEVFKITALGPPDDKPTAVQCWASGHETPVKSVTIPG